MRIAVCLLIYLGCSVLGVAQSELMGAWETKSAKSHIVMILSGAYFSAAVYNTQDNTFLGACGGRWKVSGADFLETHEFNTMKPEWIGKELKSEWSIHENKLTFKTDEGTEEFFRVDNGTPGSLSGAWLMTGRMTDKGIQNRPPGPRKTMKMLSGTRFQWIAYNVDTKEFFGTGGGTYTTENGKYTESIEFFSRDNTRIGMKLQFDFSFLDDSWRHKGLSSKGDPIDEIWSRREKIEMP